MRSFPDIRSFTSYMRGRVASLPAARRHGLERATHTLLEEAKALPGTHAAGWPALKPETIAHKATGDSPLLESGGFRESLGASVLSDRRAMVGTNDKRGPWFENGTSKMAPRPVLGAALAKKGEQAADQVAAAIARHINGQD